MDNETLFPDWSIPSCAHHNVRVICDQEGLNWSEKQELTACVMQESEFDINAKNYNYAFDKETGEKHLASTDYGICQWNDYYHGKEITPNEAQYHPEKAVRLMCAYWKRGEAAKRQWISYKSGAYRKFLGKV